MTREHLQTLSSSALWLLAKDAYERQIESEVPNYINKQLSIVNNCLEIIFDRMERGEKHETPSH